MDKNDPSTPSLAYQMMRDRWEVVTDVAGGTETMREAGQTHLPRHHMEPYAAYKERLERAVFFNMFSLTTDYLVGKPFAEPVKLSEDVPEPIKKMAEDIDMQGNDLNQYCQAWFRCALEKGFSHTLIETPATGGEQLTLAAERRRNIRPYWVHIDPENLIAAEATRINGKETLTHIRFREFEVERDGFAESEVEYIKQLEVVDMIGDGDPEMFRVELTRWRRGTGIGSSGWEEVERRMTDLKAISLVTFYTNRQDFMVSKPPLLDLAYLNISHWQSESDQLATLTVCRFPMLAASGVTEYGDEEGGRPSVVVGPHALLTTDDPQGRFYYVEHGGAALQAGTEHAGRLESQMALYGAQLLKPRPDRETATSRSLDEAAATAPLQRMTFLFLDMVTAALKITGELAGTEFKGSVRLKTDFALAENEVTDLQTLIALRKDREISRDATMEELKYRNVLRDDYDQEKDLAQLKKEAKVMAELAPAPPPGQARSGPEEEPGNVKDDPREAPNNEPPKTE